MGLSDGGGPGKSEEIEQEFGIIIPWSVYAAENCGTAGKVNIIVSLEDLLVTLN